MTVDPALSSLRQDGAIKACLLPGLLLFLWAIAAGSSRFHSQNGSVNVFLTDRALNANVEFTCGGVTAFVPTNNTALRFHPDPVLLHHGWQPTLNFMADLSLCAQLFIMSTIVYLSSQTAKDIPGSRIRYTTPVANVLRAVIGSLLFCCIEVAVVNAAWNSLVWNSMSNAFLSVIVLMSMVPLRFLFGYNMSANSEYMFHRFIFHSPWSMKSDFVLFRAVRRHYVHHCEGHHKHLRDPEVRSLMAQLHEKPLSDARRLKTETNPRLFIEDAEVLQCTHHGVTTGADDKPSVWKWRCRMHFTLMFLSMPSGTALFVNTMFGSWFGVLVHCISVVVATYFYKHHEMYHCFDANLRRQWAERHCLSSLNGSFFERLAGRCLFAMWTSKEMNRTIADHEYHHDKGAEYFGASPYSRFFVFPMWQTW